MLIFYYLMVLESLHCNYILYVLWQFILLFTDMSVSSNNALGTLWDLQHGKGALWH